MKFESCIQSKIKRKEFSLFNTFTIARISQEPSTKADIKNLNGNGIKKEVPNYEYNEANNENINGSSSIALRYSKEFASLLETLPYADKILKDTVILPKNLFETGQ